jgi:hypothetical protein
LHDFLGELVPILKRRFSPNSLLLSKFNPWNIAYMPAVKFIERLDLRKNPSFQDGNELVTQLLSAAQLMDTFNGVFGLIWRSKLVDTMAEVENMTKGIFGVIKQDLNACAQFFFR